MPIVWISVYVLNVNQTQWMNIFGGVAAQKGKRRDLNLSFLLQLIPGCFELIPMLSHFILIWLVVWSIFDFPFHIFWIIIPTGELIFFRGVASYTTNQQKCFVGKSPFLTTTRLHHWIQLCLKMVLFKSSGESSAHHDMSWEAYRSFRRIASGKLPRNYGKIHHFKWKNSLFLWPFSKAFCMFTRPGITIIRVPLAHSMLSESGYVAQWTVLESSALMEFPIIPVHPSVCWEHVVSPTEDLEGNPGGTLGQY